MNKVEKQNLEDWIPILLLTTHVCVKLINSHLYLALVKSSLKFIYKVL